jgi:hypothetical protein
MIDDEFALVDVLDTAGQEQYSYVLLNHATLQWSTDYRLYTATSVTNLCRMEMVSCSSIQSTFEIPSKTSSHFGKAYLGQRALNLSRPSWLAISVTWNSNEMS